MNIVIDNRIGDLTTPIYKHLSEDQKLRSLGLIWASEADNERGDNRIGLWYRTRQHMLENKPALKFQLGEYFDVDFNREHDHYVVKSMMDNIASLLRFKKYKGFSPWLSYLQEFWLDTNWEKLSKLHEKKLKKERATERRQSISGVRNTIRARPVSFWTPTTLSNDTSSVSWQDITGIQLDTANRRNRTTFNTSAIFDDLLAEHMNVSDNIIVGTPGGITIQEPMPAEESTPAPTEEPPRPTPAENTGTDDVTNTRLVVLRSRNSFVQTYLYNFEADLIDEVDFQIRRANDEIGLISDDLIREREELVDLIHSVRALDHNRITFEIGEATQRLRDTLSTYQAR